MPKKKIILKFTVVSAELHCVWSHPEQIMQQYNSVFWPYSPQKREKSFVLFLWGKVFKSSEELCHGIVEGDQ
jgi:hypothetical protein